MLCSCECRVARGLCVEGWEMMGVSLWVVGVSNSCMLGVREESDAMLKAYNREKKGGRRMVVMSKGCIGSGCTEYRGCRRRRKDGERRRCEVRELHYKLLWSVTSVYVGEVGCS